MSSGREEGQPAPAQEGRREALHEAHVACWRDVQLAVSLNDRAIAAYEREHGPMTEDERRLVR